MSLQAQIESVKTLATSYQAIIDLSTALQSIASIEQATAEATAAYNDALNNREIATQELRRVNEMVVAANEDLQKLDAEAGLKRIQAETAAQEIVAAAKIEAQGLNQDAETSLTEAKSEVADLKRQADAIGKDIAAKQNELDVLIAKIESTRNAALAALGA